MKTTFILLIVVACVLGTHARKIPTAPKVEGSPESLSEESASSASSEEAMLGAKRELTGPAIQPPMPKHPKSPNGMPYQARKPESAGRNKRDVCGHTSMMNNEEKLKSIVFHNNHRASEGGADVTKLVWSGELADRAQEWADKCEWQHGLLTDCENGMVGQNLYMISKGSTYPSIDMTSVINAWFNEKSDYDYTSTTCNAGKMCGHYTQVVWGTSAEMGCAVTQCPQVTIGVTTPWYNAVIVACDYRPAGNYRGEHPYIRGPACSLCHNNPTHVGYTCEDALCAECDPVIDPGCTCITRSCVNGGAWSGSGCKCDCPAGFYGRLCQHSCTCRNQPDYYAYCDSWLAFCTDATYAAFMQEYCPRTCGYCGDFVPDPVFCT